MVGEETMKFLNPIIFAQELAKCLRLQYRNPSIEQIADGQIIGINQIGEWRKEYAKEKQNKGEKDGDFKGSG